MDLDKLRKLTLEDIKHLPDDIKIYVVCNADSAIDTTYYTGWYIKNGDHVQSDKGYVPFTNSNFDFYVKFQYSLPVAQQLMFDVATELHTGFEGLDNQILADKLYDVINQIDNMELWKR